MAYEKIGFNKGDVLTAAHMNHIEEGIGALDTGKLDTDELTAGADIAFGWTKYLMLAIVTGDYSNIRECTVVPTAEFAETTETHRVILSWGNSRIEVYKADDTTIHAVGSSLNDNQRCRIFGLIKTA